MPERLRPHLRRLLCVATTPLTPVQKVAVCLVLLSVLSHFQSFLSSSHLCRSSPVLLILRIRLSISTYIPPSLIALWLSLCHSQSCHFVCYSHIPVSLSFLSHVTLIQSCFSHSSLILLSFLIFRSHFCHTCLFHAFLTFSYLSSLYITSHGLSHRTIITFLWALSHFAFLSFALLHVSHICLSFIFSLICVSLLAYFPHTFLTFLSYFTLLTVQFSSCRSLTNGAILQGGTTLVSTVEFARTASAIRSAHVRPRWHRTTPETSATTIVTRTRA